MLKRLLSRDAKGKVAKGAKESLDSVASAPARSADLEAAPGPKPPPTPQVVRKAKSMRDSDIKDEHGRSAEELAAEAAKEFDIVGLARRVNEMPDAPVIKPKAATPAPATDKQAKDVPPAPVVQIVAPEPVPVTALTIESGHILSPAPAAGTTEASLLARDVYWAQYGISDDAFLEYDTPPSPSAAPSWPTASQKFRIVRTENSLIVASEGLSDPFECFQGPADKNGFGQEVFIEVPGLPAATPDLIRNSWVFRSVEFVARLIAHNGGVGELLDEHGVMSLDLATNCVPRDWIVPGVAEPAGALLDVPMSRGRNLIADMPLSPVRVVPLTLIFPEELEDCIIGGPKERSGLVNDLLTTGHSHKTDTQRASLR